MGGKQCGYFGCEPISRFCQCHQAEVLGCCQPGAIRQVQNSFVETSQGRHQGTHGQAMDTIQHHDIPARTAAATGWSAQVEAPCKSLSQQSRLKKKQKWLNSLASMPYSGTKIRLRTSPDSWSVTRRCSRSRPVWSRWSAKASLLHPAGRCARQPIFLDCIISSTISTKKPFSTSKCANNGALPAAPSTKQEDVLTTSHISLHPHCLTCEEVFSRTQEVWVNNQEQQRPQSSLL